VLVRIASLSLPLVCTVLLAAAPPADYRVSGPYTHDNLSLFLIHGSSGGKTSYLTLKDALAQKKVVVHESTNVNELAIENLSDRDVFIQGGDIVKGGEQDRVLSNDFVLGPRSGKTPISAFCVEHGRWSQRGAEPARQFASSAGKADAIGLAFAVNGEVNSAGLYSSPELFAAMWPKLLKSSAVEAVRLLEKGKSFPPSSISAVQALLRDAEAGKESAVDINRRVKLVSRESDKEILFESRDGTGWIHHNYIKE
jgi:hypothetical protein